MRRLDLYTLLLAMMISICACSTKPVDPVRSESMPDIYPDYIDVAVPVNIAPLNFLVRTPCDAVYVTAVSQSYAIDIESHNGEVTFPIKKWRQLLSSAAGSEIEVSVCTRTDGAWTEYRPFHIYVKSDSIDAYLTYRLIEPDYEVFDHLQIQERCVEDFSVRNICDYNMVGNRCMNCHTYGANRQDLSFLYVRGDGGGMILNRDGKLSKLALKTDDMVSGSVYAQFSPSGNYIAFSSNVIIPAFHSNPSKRLEVFDTKSDIYVADLNSNRILRCPMLADSMRLSTFPTFSPDGRYIYFCEAEGPIKPHHIDSLQYNLCRIGFDESTGKVGSVIDTLVRANISQKSSVSHPRVSPDGRFLLYNVADYGTFPIWHPEADLCMMNLVTGDIDMLDDVNSDKSDTYHSWSSNGRWFVFASKRDDGLYGKPYFCYVDSLGHVSKPFVLPQRAPSFYDNCLKSFNVPEMGKSQVIFDAYKVADALKGDPVTFR